MAVLWRSNSFTEIRGVSPSILMSLSRHLAVPVKTRGKSDARFSHFFEAVDHITGENSWWGSLVHGNIVSAGLTPHVRALLESYRVPCEVRDTRRKPDEQIPLWSVQASWRPYQDEVHKQIARYGVGVVDAPPRSGKTLMAVRAVDTLNTNTLYLAPSVAIVNQTYLKFVSIFGSDFVARVDGQATPEQRDLSKQIVIATAASAVKLPQEFYDTRELLIIDEFHHGAAETYHLINAKARNIYYRICLTGTHFRTADDRLAMEALCSELLYSIPVPYLVQNRYLATPRVVISRAHGKLFRSSDYSETYQKGIVECEPRNERIALIAKTMGFDNAQPTLVLTKRRQHADELGKLIPDSVVVKGGENALTGDAIDAFKRGHVPVLIGTGVLGEGVDLPNAKVLVYAAGGGGSVQQIQSYFRPLTADLSMDATIYDFNDHHHQTLSRQSNDRITLAQQHLGDCVVRL